jgi:hypothetical protein
MDSRGPQAGAACRSASASPPTATVSVPISAAMSPAASSWPASTSMLQDEGATSQ